PNLLQYPICLFGVLRTGAVVVNTNPLYTPSELEHQLQDAGAETIVIAENFAHTLQKALPNTPVKTIIKTSVGDMLRTLRGAITNLVVRHVKKLIPAYSLPNTLDLKQVLDEGSRMRYTRPELVQKDLALLQYTGG